MTHQPRTPAGSPEGGQFAATTGAEGTSHLETPIATIDDIAEGRATLSRNPADTDTRDWLLDAEATLATRMGTSVPELSILASSQFWVVRHAVARHPATSDAALLALAEDKSPDVRGAVAANPNTPSTALAGLCNDSVPFVRATASLNQPQG